MMWAIMMIELYCLRVFSTINPLNVHNSAQTWLIERMVSIIPTRWPNCVQLMFPPQRFSHPQLSTRVSCHVSWVSRCWWIVKKLTYEHIIISYQLTASDGEIASRYTFDPFALWPGTIVTMNVLWRTVYPFAGRTYPAATRCNAYDM